MASKAISTGLCWAALALALGPAACGTKWAVTAGLPDETTVDSSSLAAACGSTLASRLAVTTIDLDEDVRYRRESYNYFPSDARIAFGVSPTGNSYVAWTNNAFTTAHVTPLTALQTRRGPDTLIPGYEIGGLVAREDGFMLLLARDDPGTPLINPNPAVQPSYGLAAVAVRVRADAIAFSAALTGTTSIVNAGAPVLDCTSDHFDGRLAFNGNTYGALFSSHGCQGASNEGYYADKLAYLDDQGQPVAGGWNWGCQIDLDLRLVPEATNFTSLCIADSASATASDNGGIVLETEGALPKVLTREFARRNVTTAQFGTLIKLPQDGGYVLTWLSRGGPNADDTLPLKPANDIAMMHIGPAPDYAPSSITWITNTPAVHEMNLHAAPYGPSKLLLAWDAVENFNCGQVNFQVTCFGDYTGTHFQVVDLTGAAVGPDEVLHAPPNERDDFQVFPNGDIGWAFVPDPGRNYANTLGGSPWTLNSSVRMPSLPAIRKISVARLLYCP